MKIILGSGNRITIPKEIIQELNLVYGQSLYINIIDNNIVISNNDISKDLIQTNCEEKIEDTQENNSKEINNKQEINSIISNNKPIKEKGAIYSNLEEAKNYYTKKYSDCGLLVRTKKCYLEKACERCRGQLVRENGDFSRPCKYLIKEYNNDVLNNKNDIDLKKEESDKSKERTSDIYNSIENNKKRVKDDIISRLAKNISTVNERLDNQIVFLNKSDSQKETKDKILFEKESNTILTPINYNEFRKCKHCKEYFSSGFLHNDIFYCKDCTVKRFKNYLELYKNKKKGSN